jgi:antitoxin FitA
VVAQILIRNLPDDVKDGLKKRAERHQRSLEAEAREILSAAVSVDPVLAWLDDSEELRTQFGGLELPVPERTAARPVSML